jgi:hypothetical protein
VFGSSNQSNVPKPSIPNAKKDTDKVGEGFDFSNVTVEDIEAYTEMLEAIDELDGWSYKDFQNALVYAGNGYLGNLPEETVLYDTTNHNLSNDEKYQTLFNEWIKTSPDRFDDLSAVDFFKMRMLREGINNNISMYSMEKLDQIYQEEYEYKSQIHGVQGLALTMWGAINSFRSAVEENGIVQPLEGAGSVGKGFNTFNDAKKFLGSPGEGKQWHHIVEQSQINKTGFSSTQIQNTNNLIAVDSATHAKISGYYSSKQAFTGGKTVRNWLAGQSYEKQFEFGMQKLRDFGVIK